MAQTGISSIQNKLKHYLTNPAEFRQLPLKQQLHYVHLAYGQDKSRLIFNSSKPETLVPLLHPQELYLTITDLGAEDSLELINLASPGQISLILDLDCWDKDLLDDQAALHWLEFLQHCDESRLCRLLRESEPESLALMLKKNLTILRGLEAYDDDDAENSKRLESLYDIEYHSEDAAKIIGAVINVWQEQEQPAFLQLMELLRNESLTVLEEEAYQRRTARLLDLGIVPELEARSVYARVDPENFICGDKPDFGLEAETLPNPLALLKTAVPNQLLAAVLDEGLPHESACELMHLVNRKLSADRVDLSSAEQVREGLQQTYDLLNLALEYLSGKDRQAASRMFHNTWLQRLFQLGHTLVKRLQQRAEKLKISPLLSFFDEEDNLFIDQLTQTPPRFYCPDREECPATLSPIHSVRQLRQIEVRLNRIEALDQLFQGPFAGLIDQLPIDPAKGYSLNGIFMTAVANRILGQNFTAAPLQPGQLHRLKQATMVADKPLPGFVTELNILLSDVAAKDCISVENCIEQWCAFLSDTDQQKNNAPVPPFLLIHSD